MGHTIDCTANGLAFTPVDPLNNTSNTNESTEFPPDENKMEEFDRHSVDVENSLAFKKTIPTAMLLGTSERHSQPLAYVDYTQVWALPLSLLVAF